MSKNPGIHFFLRIPISAHSVSFTSEHWFPPGIRVPAYVIRDAGTRPLGISPAHMENREEYLLQLKGLEHVRAALSTVNCGLIVQHVAMSTPYLGNGRLVPAAVAGEAQCQACNP